MIVEQDALTEWLMGRRAHHRRHQRCDAKLVRVPSGARDGPGKKQVFGLAGFDAA